MTSMPAAGAHPPAGLDRRFYAFALDRLLAWTVYAGVVLLACLHLFGHGRTSVGIAVVSGTVILVGVASALVLGLTGSSLGMAAAGLRVVREDSGRPIGVGTALLRTLVLGGAALPTAGFGIAALALNCLRDPSGQRRGWHDRLSHAVVIDVRPPPVVEPVVADVPRQIVNLTAMRLIPAEAPPPPREPVSAEAPLPVEPVVDPTPTPTPTPRLQLGPPLVQPLGPPPSAPPAGLLTGPPAAGAAEPSHAAPPPAPPPAVPPATAPPSVPPSVLSTARWRVTFDTGESFVVAGLTLVGRRPEPRPGEAAARMVALPSTDMSLSKTHAQFQVVPDGALVVMDRGSTNGSILVRAGVSKPLPAGRPSTLRDGDRVRFGDRQMVVAREG